jgi:hypothetical protein
VRTAPGEVDPQHDAVAHRAITVEQARTIARGPAGAAGRVPAALSDPESSRSPATNALRQQSC